MQSVSSRIWTRVAVSITYDDNHYTTGTSSERNVINLKFGWGLELIEQPLYTYLCTYIYIYIYICVCVCVCVCVFNLFEKTMYLISTTYSFYLIERYICFTWVNDFIYPTKNMRRILIFLIFFSDHLFFFYLIVFFLF